MMNNDYAPIIRAMLGLDTPKKDKNMTKGRGPQKNMTKAQAFEKAIQTVAMIRGFLDIAKFDITVMTPVEITAYMRILDNADEIIQAVTDDQGKLKYKH